MFRFLYKSCLDTATEQYKAETGTCYTLSVLHPKVYYSLVCVRGSLYVQLNCAQLMLPNMLVIFFVYGHEVKISPSVTRISPGLTFA